MKTLNLKAIRIDGGTQPRASINQQAVEEYAEALKNGEEFPPLVVFFDGTEYWLADGFHRWHAHERAGKASAKCDIMNGTQRSAVLWSCSANASHGLRRTNDDKRRSVEMLLADAEWSQWSDRKIADACGVSHPFVASVRRPAVAVRQETQREATRERQATPAPKPAALAVTDSTPPDVSPGSADLLDEMQADLRKAEETAKAFEKAMLADDSKAELARTIRRVEHAERRQGELMEDATTAKRRSDFYEKQLARCGKAVGVSDLDKVAIAVEAMARRAKVAA